MASPVKQVEIDPGLIAKEGEGLGSVTDAVTSGEPKVRRSKASRRHRALILAFQLAIVVVVLAVWQHAGSTSLTQRLTVGRPSDVASWLGRWVRGKEAHGLADLRITMYEAMYGWVLGVLIGIVLAVVLSMSNWLRLFAAPFVAVLNALPKIALAPLFILIYGQTLRSKVYFVAAGIFFITFYNVFGGIRSIDPVYLRNAKILGANRWHLVRQVYAPAIVAWVMTSLRLTAAWAITGAVIAEYLGSLKGMGSIVSVGQQNQAPHIVIAGIVAVAFTALLIDRLIVRIERRFSAWKLA